MYSGEYLIFNQTENWKNASGEYTAREYQQQKPVPPQVVLPRDFFLGNAVLRILLEDICICCSLARLDDDRSVDRAKVHLMKLRPSENLVCSLQWCTMWTVPKVFVRYATAPQSVYTCVHATWACATEGIQHQTLDYFFATCILVKDE